MSKRGGIAVCTMGSLLLALHAAPSAQTLLAAKVAPEKVKVNEPVTVQADFDISQGLNCNVRFHFGDGQTQDVKVNQEKDATLRIPHTYAKPGRYEVMVEPKTALPALKCLGANRRAAVEVVAAATPVAAASAPARAPAKTPVKPPAKSPPKDIAKVPAKPTAPQSR